MKKQQLSCSLLILLLVCPLGARDFAAALEEESAAARAEQGDLLGAVAMYEAHYDPATRQGLVALQQIAIEVLRLGLRLGDPHERNVVAGILGRRGDPAGLFVLDEALQSNKPMLRRTAVDVLGDMATPDAVGLLRRLYYKDLEGQRLALSGLRRTRDRTALLLYLDAVSSTDTRIRTQGAGGLGELRSPAAFPVLQTLLKTEKDPIVAATLAWSLAAAGNPTGLAYLTAKLSDSSEQVRDAIVALLGSLDDPSVVPLLRTALQADSSEMVRTTAAASLAHFKDASGLPLVQAALEHVDLRIRLAAAISFTRMDYNIAKPLVIQALSSRDPLVRSTAYQVIGQNVDSSVAAEVSEAVDRERDLYAKVQGLWTVGRIGGAESLPKLLHFLPDEQEELRHASAEALVLISDRLLQSGGVPPKIP